MGVVLYVPFRAAAFGGSERFSSGHCIDGTGGLIVDLAGAWESASTPLPRQLGCKLPELSGRAAMLGTAPSFEALLCIGRAIAT